MAKEGFKVRFLVLKNVSFFSGCEDFYLGEVKLVVKFLNHDSLEAYLGLDGPRVPNSKSTSSPP